MALVATLLLAAGLFAVRPAGADLTCDSDGGFAYGYQFCGDHWRWADLPVPVYLNTANLPSGLSVPEAEAAVRGAVEAWERVASLFPLDPPGTDCSGGTRVLCYKGTTGTGKVADGNTVVLFGSTPSTKILAETRICYIGTGCPSSHASRRMKDADVTVRATDVFWHHASGAEVLATEPLGVRGPFCPVVSCPTWHDLQSVLTHEMGHVLGLEETDGSIAGCEGGGWAADPSDVLNYQQTMYPCHWAGHTNRRTLEWGDVAGLVAVYLASFADD